MGKHASECHVSLSEVEATYRRVRTDVMTLTPLQLRWCHRRAKRRARSGSTHDLVVLKAIADEYRHRGIEAPRR